VVFLMSSRLIIEGETNKIQRLMDKVRESKLFRFYHGGKFFINKHEIGVLRRRAK
jgi:hypothetical protein